MSFSDIAAQLEAIDKKFQQNQDADEALISYRILSAEVLGQWSRITTVPAVA